MIAGDSDDSGDLKWSRKSVKHIQRILYSVRCQISVYWKETTKSIKCCVLLHRSTSYLSFITIDVLGPVTSPAPYTRLVSIKHKNIYLVIVHPQIVSIDFFKSIQNTYLLIMTRARTMMLTITNNKISKSLWIRWAKK